MSDYGEVQLNLETFGKEGSQGDQDETTNGNVEQSASMPDLSDWFTNDEHWLPEDDHDPQTQNTKFVKKDVLLSWTTQRSPETFTGQLNDDDFTLEPSTVIAGNEADASEVDDLNEEFSQDLGHYEIPENAIKAETSARARRKSSLSPNKEIGEPEFEDFLVPCQAVQKRAPQKRASKGRDDAIVQKKPKMHEMDPEKHPEARGAVKAKEQRRKSKEAEKARDQIMIQLQAKLSLAEENAAVANQKATFAESAEVFERQQKFVAVEEKQQAQNLLIQANMEIVQLKQKNFQLAQQVYRLGNENEKLICKFNQERN